MEGSVRLKLFAFKSATVFTLVLAMTSEVFAFPLDLFSSKDRHGVSIRLDVSDTECSNFPVPWKSRAGSINTLGSCVHLYDGPFCKGSLTIIQPFHTIHQMDLSLINFASRVQSAKACGPKIKTGRYVIQSADDASVMTVNGKLGGFGQVITVNVSGGVITKAQQWEVVELENSEFSLKPREFEDNYPVSYDLDSLKKGKIKRKLWKLMSVGRGRYLIKHEKSQRCIYKTESRRVEEHDCRIWSPNQEWVLRKIFGPAKHEKKNAAVGPGLNYNILSKVATYRPPTKPPPEFLPIYYNATALATLRPRTTKKPYVIRKKIKRGPRPQSRPIPFLTQVRPPGLKHRPAIPSKLSNNNKYLLLKNPAKLANFTLSKFEPSDDRVETYQYYQHVMLAHAQEAELMKQAKEQALKLKLAHALQANKKKKKKPDSTNSSEEEEEYDVSEEEKRKKKTTKSPAFPPQNQQLEDIATSSESEETENDVSEYDSYEDSEENPGKSKKKKKPKRPFNPYLHINYNELHNNPELLKLNASGAFLPHDELSSGFLSSMFAKMTSGIKGMVPSVPFFSKTTTTTEPNYPLPPEFYQAQIHYAQNQYNHMKQQQEKKKRKKVKYPHLYRPPRPRPSHNFPGNFQSAITSSTTTEGSMIWGLLG